MPTKIATSMLTMCHHLKCKLTYQIQLLLEDGLRLSDEIH
jgi:hypothetical protein